MAQSALTRRAALVAIAAGGLAGCGGGGGGGLGGLIAPAPSDTFDLTAPARFPRAGPTRPIVVGEPTTLRILDTERILVRARPNEVAYVTRAQWVDRLPRLVQARLIQGFENAMRTRLVARPGDGLDADATLQTDIRTFEVDAQRNVARVEFTTRLITGRGRIVSTGMFRGEAPAGTEGRAAAEGLDRAFGDVVVQIVGWTGAGGRAGA